MRDPADYPPPTPQPTPCIIWQGALTKLGGYGRRGARRAHRMAWEEAHGPIPDGMYVLHRCDNPPCVNVEHLFLGTYADNVHDAINKGRAHRLSVVRGEEHPNAKLSRDDVEAILSSTEPGMELANRYRVSPQTISAIRRGRLWRSLRRDQPE